MAHATAEAGSFRDRRGRIYYVDGRVFRSVMPEAIEDFDYVRSSGLIDRLVERGLLVAETLVDRDLLGPAGESARQVLEHPRIPYISYPYEWSFSGLKAAALLHLDIQIEALKHGVTLTDASAYNIQFLGPRPIFIDNLSFRRYVDGEFWAGHRQYCEQFVNPLLLRAHCGVSHNAWYRGSLEGIASDELSKLLPWRTRLSWNTFTHVHMQAKLQRSAATSDAIESAQARRLPKIGFEEILRSLRKWVSRLTPKDRSHSTWQTYSTDNSYSANEADCKQQFVAQFVSAARPTQILDLGCNSGDYSSLALKSGAQRCIGFDSDQGALEIAFSRARDESLDFLPLYLDAANPSPDQGWGQVERQGFANRSHGNAVLALALVHHLAIAKNLPLDQLIDWITDMAPTGIVEFVPKSDAMVERLLHLREDLFDDYQQDNFEKLLRRRARIVESRRVTASGRMLYVFERG